ncbi:MAG: hypothetical protein HW416_3736 [Chloroflexi bacterium]|nr:hypothetical protein [Chloroflexota bacterium]
MRIITKRKLVEFWTRGRSDAKQPLIEWHQKTEAANWSMLPDVRRTFAHADQVGRLTVFNIKGNDYRLVVRIEYQLHLVFIRWLGTHDEYGRGDWKNDTWY